jgi:tripartite-type tricarboxylate transporter receptor subunit TctC
MSTALRTPRQIVLHHIIVPMLFVWLVLSGLPMAQAAYPDRPITLIVPFAPGGSSDNVARSIAGLLGDKLKQAIVIENIGGAGGVLGTQKAVRAAPDGYTMLIGSGSEILINKVINPNLSYDANRDLAPVLFIATGPMVLVGKPGLSAPHMKELLELAKAKPGALSYASAGNGTPMHVAGELLKMRANIFMTHIPYRGAAPALMDVMSGQIDLCVSTLSAAAPHIRSGKVQAYGVTSAKVSELAPDLPAIGMMPGLEGFDLGVWFGLFMPAKTPAEVLQKVQEAANQVLSDPGVRKKLADQGLSAIGTSAESLKKFMASEVDKYQSVVKAAKIKPE